MIEKFSRLDRAANAARLNPELDNALAAPRKKNAVRYALLAGSALVSAMMAGATFTSTDAWAACGQSGSTITCTGNDTNGITSVLNFGDTTLVFDPASSPPGSSGDTITIGLNSPTPGNNDLTVTMANAMSQVVGNGGNGITVTSLVGGGVQNWNIAGTVGATGGNAIGIISTTGGGTVNMTFADTAHVFANGTNDLLGVPTSGGGVVLTTLAGGTTSWSVTNHGEFSTQNDAISMYNLLGSGNNTITNDGRIGTSALAVGGSGAVIVAPLSGSNGTVNNDNGQIWATGNGGLTSDYGAVAVTAGGNAMVSNAGGTISTVNDSGIMAIGGVLAGSGTSTVASTGGTVTSTNGPGIVAGVLGTGATQVDAGVVNSGSDAYSVVGFDTVSGGVIGFSGSGGTTIGLHGDVTTTGTYGAIAFSNGGNATVTADAGIKVDPAIGMGSVVLGSGLANVVNNGTQITTQVGLLGVNIGDGAVQIVNSSTGTIDATGGGTGVLAVKIGPSGTNVPSTGYAAVVSNSGTINAPLGAGVAVIAFDPAFSANTNNVQINNDFGNTSIVGQGGLLTPAVAALADGTIEINNTRGALIDTATGVSGNGVFALGGLDVTMNNNRGATINGVANLISIAGSATMNNDRGADWNFSGISSLTGNINATLNNNTGGDIVSTGNSSLSVIGITGNATLANGARGDITMGTGADINNLIVAAGVDATLTNDRGSSITMNGTNVLSVGGGGNGSITNDRGSDMTLTGASVVTVLAGNTGAASVTNDRGGDMSNTGGIVMTIGAGTTGTASLTNQRGGSLSLGTVGGTDTNVLTMVAGGNVTTTNDRGGDMSMNGGNGFSMISTAGSTSLTNDNNSSLTMAGSANVLTMIGNIDSTMTTDRGSDMTLTGGSVVTVLAGTSGTASVTNDRGGDMSGTGGTVMTIGAGATGAATMTNDRGGSLVLGTDGGTDINVVTMAAGGNVTTTTDRGGLLSMEGGNVFTMLAGGNATMTTGRGGTFVMTGVNVVGLSGDNATINNNGGGQTQLTGLSLVTLTATDTVNGVAAINNSANNSFSNDSCSILNGVCVNGLATFTGGANTQLQFNNSGGLLSMLNGYNGFGDAVYATGFGSEIGDETIINGNFNASTTSQLGVDARLGGVASSAADLVVVDNTNNTGQVTGQTGIIVNSGNNPGQYNPVGIPIVAVNSGLTSFSNFYIDPQSSFYTVKNGEGVIDKGMFFYAHELVPSPTVPGGEVHVLVGLPDTETYQMAYVASGAQNLWYDTALNWIDKQDNLHKRSNDRQIGDGSGFGVWVQGVGAWTKRDANQSVMNSGFNVDTSYHQDTYGILAGVDWTSRSNGNVFQIGVLGGYADSKLTFDASSADNSFHYKGALVGATASFMSGGFFIDGLFKVDLMKMNARMGSLGDFGNTTFDTNVTSYGGMANGGYRFDMNSWYVEGLATLAYVRTNIDKKSLQDTDMDWQDGQSLRGAVGARIGTTFATGGLPTMDVSLLGRVWNEFDGRNKVTVDAGGPSFSVSDGAMKNKPFGEIAGLIDLVDIGSGWSGFVNAGVKFNADFTTITAKGGLRYQFGAVAPAPMAPPPAAPPPPMATAKKNFIVFFDFDKSNITSQAQTTINDAVAAAKAGNSARVTLTGHTDRSGSEQYNMALSLRRAEAVKANMIKQGIPASAIVVIGKGESQPLVPTADGVREPQNRRVEIVI